MVQAPRAVLITGASSGLGKALALAYAAPGITLALLGRHEARLTEVAKACEAKGALVQAVLADIRDREAMHEIICSLDDARPFDLVIANAGISAGTFSGEDDLKAAQAVFDVNLQGVLNTLHPIIPRMVARGRGQLVIISSLASILPLPGAAAYSASKAAVRYYGEALAGHLRPQGVQVSVVCPGWIRTPLVDVNDFPMPFIMSATRAARIIQRDLLRCNVRIAFPRRLYFSLRLLEALPSRWTRGLMRALPSK